MRDAALRPVLAPAGLIVCLLAVGMSPAQAQADGQAGPAPGEWGMKAPLLEPNSEFAVAELDGRIYVLGGYPAGRVTVRTVQIYDTPPTGGSSGRRCLNPTITAWRRA